MKKVCCIFIAFVLIYGIEINLAFSRIVNAETQSVEVLIDGVDLAPATEIIGECNSVDNSIELWHYSGGYWKYKGLVIKDEVLEDDLRNSEKLAQLINEEIIFEIPIEQNLYNKLANSRSIKVVCSTTLKNQKTSENIPITDLFYDRPIIEVKNNKIYFKAKPKLHFYTKDMISYQKIIGDKFNVTIPIVDPDYGYNTYAIWKRTAAVQWGAVNGYFDKEDPFAGAPADSNLLAPAQIKNADGHLYDGFTFKTGETTRSSDNSSVGYYTFRNGGAVGIVFKYPIKFTFYSDETPRDLSAHFETLPSSATKGEKVQVCVNVRSNFGEDLESVPFKWEITKADGTPLKASDQLEFIGSSKLPEGTIDISGKTQQAIFYADFIMPSSDVKVKFSINGGGSAPSETNLGNNTIDSGESVKLVEDISYSGKFDLDYNVLERRVRFPLINGADITAKLILPRGDWLRNAKGKLNVENDTTNIYHDFSADNTNVDEWKDTIVRNPVIYTTLHRIDFGDKPLEHKWLSLEDAFEPRLKSGRVVFDGSVSRTYTYKYYDACMKREDGTTYCNGHTVNTTTSAAFNSGTDTREIRTFIYNGRANMPNVAARNFVNKVENNGWQRNLLWTSDPYKFDVIRWMCYIDEDNKPYNWTKVDGQYKRTFTQQNTASINWAVKNSMANLYNYDRENARKMNYGKAYYPNAVFATDKGLQKYDWPIKSGYYFNPLGEYTCTVKTVQYKNTSDTTSEHTELVNKIKNSFHYTSNMLYTSDGVTYQSLNLQNGNDKIFGMDMLDITTSYSKNQTKLEHYDNSAYADKTHKFFKEILEGYMESNTDNSRENFKYREYIKRGDIYKVEETTVINFRVASPSDMQKLYTYIKMKDGQYSINAGVDSIMLDKYMYNGLRVSGLSSIDNISVTVNGSMYDDQNATLGN